MASKRSLVRCVLFVFALVALAGFPNLCTASVSTLTTATFKVTYSGNGNTGGAAPVDSVAHAAGAKVTVKGNTGNLTRTGYTFNGWNTTAGGSGTTYAAGSILIMGSANVTLFAQWKIAPTYTITYRGNFNTGGTAPVDPARYADGTKAAVKSNTGDLVRTGYFFNGWNTKGGGLGAAYAAGSTLIMGNANVTLYAQWKAEEVVSVWGGAQDVIALKSDGTVWTWGANWNGEIGDGNTQNVSTPTQVLGPEGVGHLESVKAVMGGELFNIALKTDGTVWAWGFNTYDELGDGSTMQSPVPVQVSGLSSIVSLGSRAYHALAVKSDGTVWAWGSDKGGALGNGQDDMNPDFPVPSQVNGVSDPIMVTAGYCFSVALLKNQTLVAWGKNNAGQLGDGTTTERLAPVAVVGISDVAWVSAGWGQVVAVKTDGTVWTWGSNQWGGNYPGCGLLGDGKDCTTEPYRATPAQVPGLSGAYRAWGGDGHTAVLMKNGTVWTFGSNQAGQLGTGMFTLQSLVPVQVVGTEPGEHLSNVVNMTARDFHNQAILADGSVWSWGSGLSGELGNGTDSNSPVPVKVSPF